MKKHETALAALRIGALWGLAEATVGTLLHEISLPIGSYVWFPLAYLFLHWAYRRTGNRNAMLAAAVVAATIKLTGLFLPIRIDRVINPALSILLEGLAVWAVLATFEKRGWKQLLLPAAANALWRVAYLVCMLILPLWIRTLSPLSGLQAAFKFGIIDMTASSIVAVGVSALFGSISARTRSINTEHSPTWHRVAQWSGIPLMVMSLVVQWMLW